MQYPNNLTSQEWGMVFGCPIYVPLQETVGTMTSLSAEYIGVHIGTYIPLLVNRERAYPLLSPVELEEIEGKSMDELLEMLRKGKDVQGWIKSGKAFDIAIIL